MEYHGGGRNIVQMMLSKAYSDGCGRDGMGRESLESCRITTSPKGRIRILFLIPIIG